MTSTQITPLGKLFGLLTKKYIGIISHKLKHLDIDRHFYAIYLISKSPEPFTQKAMAEQLSVDKATMVRIADYLSNAGYINRKLNPNDRREQFLDLTKKGKNISVEIIRAFEDTDALFLEGVMKGDQQNFIEELHAVFQFVEPIDSDQVKLNYKKLES
jgi:MarR family transcriptional regulator, transcriptional regulator for hemolysin